MRSPRQLIPDIMQEILQLNSALYAKKGKSMGSIENLISIATEKRTFLTSAKIVMLSRLIISIDKIIDSFKQGATRPKDPQMVHIQNIEDILYKNPNFFDNSIIDGFFRFKNDLDSGVINFPFNEEHKPIFEELKNKASRKRDDLRTREKIENYVIYAVLAILLLKFLF